MINDLIKVGDQVNVPDVKNPVTITYVGRATAEGTGMRGRKFMFAQNIHSGNVYCHFSGKEVLINL